MSKPDPDDASSTEERERVRRGEELCTRCGHARSLHSAWKWDPPHACEATIGGECSCEDFKEKDFGPMADLNLYLWWRKRK